MKAQTNIRLSPAIKAALKQLSEAEGLSEGQFVEQLVKAEVKRRKRRKPI
jgi:hypothetical protein